LTSQEGVRTVRRHLWDLLDASSTPGQTGLVEGRGPHSHHLDRVLGRGLDLENGVAGVDRARESVARRLEADDIGDLTGRNR
jgi:hypothetical protein